MLYYEEEKDRLELNFFLIVDDNIDVIVPGVTDEAYFETYIYKGDTHIYPRLIYALEFIFEKIKEIAEHTAPRDDFTRKDGEEDSEFF